MRLTKEKTHSPQGDNLRVGRLTLLFTCLMLFATSWAGSRTIYLLNDFKAASASDVKVYYYGYNSEGEKVGNSSVEEAASMSDANKYAKTHVATTVSGDYQGAKIFSFEIEESSDWDQDRGIDVVFVHPNLKGVSESGKTDAIRLKDGDETLFHAANNINNGLRNSDGFLGSECYGDGEWNFAEPKMYTMYYVDTANKVGNSDIHFMYWHYNTDRVGDWNSVNSAENSPYTKFEKTEYIKYVNGNTYPVYKLEFEWEVEPEGGLLWLNKSSVGSIVNFVNNGLYSSAGGDNIGVITNPRDDFDKIVENTIYFYDRDNWGGSGAHIAVHYFTSEGVGITNWGNFNAVLNRVKNGDGSNAIFNPTKDLEYPLYSYSFNTYPGDPEPGGLLFVKINDKGNIVAKTEDYIFNNGNLYTQSKAKNNSGMEDWENYSYENKGITQTVYFYDQQSWYNDSPAEGEPPTDISLHFWGDNIDNNALAGWAGNKYRVERVIDENGNEAVYHDDLNKEWPLYKFAITVEDDQKITGIIFRKFNAATNTLFDPNVGTNDLVYTENALYTNNSSKNFEGIAYDKWNSALSEYTVYFADAGAWGADKTMVHMWSGWGATAEPFTEWNVTDPTMQPTDRYYRVGDTYAPVYKYTVQTRKMPDGLIFHTELSNRGLQNNDMEFVNFGLYSYAGNMSTPDVTEYIDNEEKLIALTVSEEEIPQESRWVYFNIGANQLDRTWQWKEPCAMFFENVHGVTDYATMMPEYSTDENSDYAKSKMEMVRPGYYRVKCDDIYRMRDVVFYYYSTDRKVANVFPASYALFDSPSVEMDYTTWATYVYSINYASAIQTYCTPDRFEELWHQYENNGLLRLYMTSADLFKEQGVGMDDVRNCVVSDSDEGLFVFKIDLPAEKGEGQYKYISNFKLSFISVKDEFKHVDELGAAYDNVRGWGTFNLGVIGCSKDESRGWRYGLNDKYIVTDEDYGLLNDDNEQKTTRFNGFFVPLNYTIGFNTYNQYEWAFFRKGSLTMGQEEPECAYEAGTYYVAIDTHPDHYSVSFLDFDPMPSFEVVYDDENVEKAKSMRYPLDYSDAQKLHSGSMFAASECEGDMYIDEVNVSGVTINIASAYDVIHGEDSEESSMFSPKFLISVNGGESAEISDTGAGLYRVDCLPPNRENDLSFRTVYFNKQSGQSFCSHVSRKSVDTSADMPEPDVIVWRTKIGNCHYTDETKQYLVYDAALECDYNVDSELVAYPDFACTCASKARLVHADDWAAIQHGFGVSNHVPYDGESEYSDLHNWSKMIRDGKISYDGELAELSDERLEKNLNMYLQDAVVFDMSNITTPVVSPKVYACYPFLVTSIPQVRPLAMQAKSPARAPQDFPFDLSGSSLTVYSVSNEQSIPIQDSVYTGISNLLDESDREEVVFYNLQGIRIPAPQAGNMYIECRGKKAELKMQ